MITELRISRKDTELIQAELEANRPYEACGVLIGTMDSCKALVEEARPVINSNRTRTSFELDPRQFYVAGNDAERTGKASAGIHQTPPVSTEVPSLWDRKTM